MTLGFGYADAPPEVRNGDGNDQLWHTVAYLSLGDRLRVLLSGKLHVIIRGSVHAETGRLRLKSSHRVPW